MNRPEITVLAVFLVALSFVSQSEGAPVETIVAFTHVTVIDGTGADPKPDMTVLVRGARIDSVVSADAATLPPGARVVGCKGSFLIPGLWDMHVHLAKAGANTLPLFIANGVTSVRDMGGDYAEVLRWRNEILSGKRLGPRIKTAGPILESARNVERMRREGTVEPVERTRVRIADPAAAGVAIDSVARLGVDFLKIRTVSSPETYTAIAEAAKRVGLPLVGHAVATPEQMIQAGQRSVEHVLFPPLNDKTEEERSQLFKRFVENGIASVPTLVNGEKSLFVTHAEAANVVEDLDGKVDPRRQYLSGYLIEDWREQLAERKTGPQIDWKSIAPSLQRDIREMYHAGVRIMPGTDVAVLLIYPGFSLHDELQLLVRDVGMTPMEALVSATRSPAEFFGLQDTLGTVEAGKIADLVVLDADPLEDIRNTQRIRGVVVDGMYRDRAALDDVLAEVKSAARELRSCAGVKP